MSKELDEQFLELGRLSNKAVTLKMETNAKLSAQLDEMKKAFDGFSQQKVKLVGSPLDLIRNEALPFDFGQQHMMADLNTSSFFPVQTSTSHPYANHSFAVGANTSQGQLNTSNVLRPIQPSLNFVSEPPSYILPEL